MQIRIVVCAAVSVLSIGLLAECMAEVATNTDQTKSLSQAALSSVKSQAKEATAVAKQTEPKKQFATLGSPDKATPSKAAGKPKFMLRNSTPMARNVGGDAQDRAAEVKRLIDAYEGIALRYSDNLVLAETPEAKAAFDKRAPSARALRPIAVLIANLVAVDPTDEPALDAMVFLSKFVKVPEIEAVLAGDSSKGANTKFDLITELLTHHADNDKVIKACRRLPRGEETDIFLHKLAEKTFNPAVRWQAGAQLFASHRRNNRTEAMEKLAVFMSEDRYLEGVVAGHELSARQWATNKVREIRTLGIGQELPEVFGNKIGGDTEKISDYRGKVVLLDVWTTWCGPCKAMIPHHVHLMEELKDKPFAILSVSCDRERETLENYLEENSMPWDHWWVAPDSEFKKTLNIGSYPTIYVLDAKGVIRHKNIRDGQLEEAVEALLKELDQS